jgi:hypothetical protein
MVTKVKVPLIEENTHPTPHGTQQDIQEPIPIKIRKDDSTTGRAGAGQGSRDGYALEFPSSKIPVKMVGRVNATEKKIRPPVFIQIADSDTGPVEEDTVGGAFSWFKIVPEDDPGLRGLEEAEPNVTRTDGLDRKRFNR